MKLVNAFAGDRPGEVPTWGWDNHRWIRFRTAMAGLAGWLDGFHGSYQDTTSGGTPYGDLAGPGADAPLPSYPLSGVKREALNERTGELVGLATAWDGATIPPAPKPAPRLRLVPDDGTAGRPRHLSPTGWAPRAGGFPPDRLEATRARNSFWRRNNRSSARRLEFRRARDRRRPLSRPHRPGYGGGLSTSKEMSWQRRRTRSACGSTRTPREAAEFYASVFPDSRVDAVHRAPGDFPGGKEGDVLTVHFTLRGIPCMGLNGGPNFPQSEAFSFQIATDDQAETDRYWDAIVGNGGQESACGWCKDRWGMSADHAASAHRGHGVG